ncbi:HutD family protein [Kiloniella laminariae]|uniref:HutD family protein n=1 Tax=Kiloniella laminariae TaxID=454162 RepID=A0ABT4LEK9_9PROT|nr:HutD family protein [Kiloniella laminariae]MCZ4279535.1 HutD family protein [Kiloniella laminariae]
MKQHLRVADYKSMPWKNGLGTTVELAVASHGSANGSVHESAHESAHESTGLPDQGDSPFLWRISIATVAQDGPFSCFPCIDRNLMILEGKGMVLDVARQGKLTLKAPLQPVEFAGDVAVEAQLTEGPITDFNVMVDRRYARASVHVLQLGLEKQMVELSGGTDFFYIPANAAAVVINADQKFRLVAGESCHLSGESGQVSLVREETAAMGKTSSPVIHVAIRHL